MKNMSVVLGVVAFAAMASAQISPGAFAPEAVDDYESYPGGRAIITSLFDGAVPVTSGTVDHRSIDFGDWSDFRAGTFPIVPSSGDRFGVLFGSGDIKLDFTGVGGIFGFSGMASASQRGNDAVLFFDMDGRGIAQDIIDGGFGLGQGIMGEFSYVSTVPIGYISFRGPETAFDDLAYTTVPAPGGLAGLVVLALSVCRRRLRQ